jgi:hypothetical protein
MLGVFFEDVLKVIYFSLYVGLSDVGQNFEEAIFLPSTSKSRAITTYNLNHYFAPTNFSLLRFRRRPPDLGTVGKLRISAFSMLCN